MATLRQLRIELGWNIVKLAQEAGVTRQSVSAAEKGALIQADTAKAIADALSRAYGRTIRVFDIEGLNIS